MSISQGYKQTDTEEIPEEWAIRKLGDERVTRLMKAGGTPLRTRKEYYENGTIPFVRIEDITTAGKYLNKTELKITEKGLNSSSTWLVPKKSILYSMYASYGEAVINTIPVATNQAIIAILRSENVDLEYLYYSLNQIKTSLYKYLRTTTQKNLNAKIVKNLKIPIPPLVEQQSIARILSCVDEAIRKTEEVIERTEMLKRGLMQRLLTRGIGHTRFKQTELGEIPDTWEINRLGALYSIYDCKHRTPNYTETGYPTIRPRDITPFITSFDSCLKTSYADYLDLTEKYTPKKGDIVYSRNASYGVAGIVLTNKKFSIGQDTVIITSDKLSTRYLFYVLNSNLIGKQIRRISTGSTFKRINLSEIRKLKILVPPISEQKHIASILWSLDSKLKTENRRRQKLAELKKGLMKGLLTGRVRVKVD